MNFLVKRLSRWVFTRLFQASSFAGYALAVWTYLGWDQSPGGLELLENVLKALAALLLFIFNEKPWTKRGAK